MQQRKFLQSSVHLGIDQYQMGLLCIKSNLQVSQLLRKALRSICDSIGIEAENAAARAVDAGKYSAEILAKPSGGCLQEVLDRGIVGCQRRLQLSGIDGESAVIVQLYSQAAEIDDAVVARDGIGDGA